MRKASHLDHYYYHRHLRIDFISRFFFLLVFIILFATILHVNHLFCIHSVFIFYLLKSAFKLLHIEHNMNESIFFEKVERGLFFNTKTKRN